MEIKRLFSEEKEVVVDYEDNRRYGPIGHIVPSRDIIFINVMCYNQEDMEIVNSFKKEDFVRLFNSNKEQLNKDFYPLVKEFIDKFSDGMITFSVFFKSNIGQKKVVFSFDEYFNVERALNGAKERLKIEVVLYDDDTPYYNLEVLRYRENVSEEIESFIREERYKNLSKCDFNLCK